MKKITIYMFVVVCILLIFNQKSKGQDTLQTSAVTYSFTPEDDSVAIALNTGQVNSNMFIKNLLAPGDSLGSIPLDIVKIESLNKVFIYGQNQIIVLNAATNTVEDTINFLHSQYYPSVNLFISQLYSAEKHFTYNHTTGLIYCSTENMNIIAIDPVTDVWSEIVPRPVSLDRQWYKYQILKYNSRKNRIYWAVSKINKSTIFIYDATTYNLINKIDLDFTLEDIEINDIKDEFYVSYNKEFRIYNDNNFTYTTFGSMVDQTGDLLYVHTDNMHKLFCFTKTYRTKPTSVFVIDFNKNNAITSFPSPLPTETACYYSITDNKIYVGFEPNNNTQKDVYIINPDNYNIEQSINTDLYSSYLYNTVHSFNELGDKIIVSKTNEISAIDKNTYVSQLIKLGVNNVYFRSVKINNKVFVISTLTGTLDIIDANLSITKTINVGEPLFFGCYNTVEHKAYFYNQNFEGNSKVYILNTLTNVISYLNIGSNISDVIYDAAKNRAYVSTYNDDNKIKVIDGQTDQLLPISQWITLNHGYCAKMLLTPNNKLYCIVGMDNNNGAGIEIRNADNNYSLIKYHSINITGALSGEFCYNPNNENVYATLRDLNAFSIYGKFVEINGNNDHIILYNIDNIPFKMVCNSYDNKIYIEFVDESIHHLTVFRCEDHSFGQIQIGYQVRSLAYASDRNIVYALYRDAKNSTIGEISDENFTPGPTVPATSITLKYNPNNFDLYVYVPYNGNVQSTGQIWEFVYTDPNNDGVGSFSTTNIISLENKNMNRVLGYLVNNDMLIDPDSNKLYVANGGFSNISVVQCTNDQDAFINGENWISFPRLPRQNNEAVNTQSVLENIDPLPYSFKLEGRKENSDDAVYATKSGPNWHTDNLPNVKSTKGYILTIPEASTPLYLLPYSGTRLNPDISMTLYANHKNWVGYFLAEQQNPFDALANVIDNLKTIKGQYWAAANMGSPGKPNWISSKTYPLHYADMLILEPFTTTAFTWHRLGNPGNNILFQDTQHYTYTPKGEYTPIFIEPDTANRPVEIGAFVNDSCIGAVKVNVNDTLVLLRSYAGSNSGDSIVFKNYYGTKSTDKHIISTYYVYNPLTERKEKHSIKLYENRDFYWVSFNDNNKVNNALQNDDQINVKLFPNPATKQITISYSLSASSYVSIELYYANGTIAQTLMQKMDKQVGKYYEQWKLKDLPKGLYFVKISTKSQTVYKKLILY